MSKQKRYYVQPCDNAGTLTDSDGKLPPRDRTWDVIDRVTGQCVYGNSYTRAEARAEADKLNAGVSDDEINPNDAESARRDRGLPARDGTSS